MITGHEHVLHGQVLHDPMARHSSMPLALGCRLNPPARHQTRLASRRRSGTSHPHQCCFCKRGEWVGAGWERGRMGGWAGGRVGGQEAWARVRCCGDDATTPAYSALPARVFACDPASLPTSIILSYLPTCMPTWHLRIKCQTHGEAESPCSTDKLVASVRRAACDVRRAACGVRRAGARMVPYRFDTVRLHELATIVDQRDELSDHRQVQNHQA